MNLKQFTNDLIAFLLPLLFVVLIYNSAFLHPSDFMFSIEGDGVKNYYTLAWFVENNADWIHHSAMKYPFGEHYLYTDGFVPFGWFFKFFDFTAVQAIGFVNFLMLFSIVLTSFFAYKILSHFEVKTYLSIIGGFAIAVLSPQMSRITGHYALGLSFFFLFSFWLYILYLKEMKSWLLTVLIFINSLFWLLIHPYLGIMVVMFMTISWIFVLLKNRKSLEKKRKVFSQSIMQSILPVVAFKVFLIFTDVHLNRPTVPWGFWEFQGTWRSVFIPSKGPFVKFFDNIFGAGTTSWEALSYVGITTSVLLIIYVVRVILLKENINIKKTNTKDWNVFTIPAFLLFILSIGVPFIWFPSLLEVFTPFRNFRALGRFAWVFYYVITLFSIYKLNGWMDKTSFRSFFKTFLLTAIIGVMVWEGVGIHVELSSKIKNPNYFKLETLSPELKSVISSAKKVDALAILSLPFYHLGTYRVQPNNIDLFNSMLVSFHTKLPLLNNDLPRTSIDENVKSISVISPDGYTKSLAELFPDNNQILLLQTSNVKRPIEELYIQNSKPLNVLSNIKLYQIETGQLKTNTVVHSVEKESLFSTQYKNHKLYSQIILDNNFEYFKSMDQTFYQEGYNVLKEFDSNSLKDVEYEFSFWYKNPHLDPMSVNIIIMSKEHAESQNTVWQNFFGLNDDNLFSQDSIFSIMTFQAKKNRHYKIVYKNPKHDIPRIECLNWMLRKTDNTIYHFDKDSLSINNHKKMPWIEIQKTDSVPDQE